LPDNSANDSGATPAFETLAPGYDARAGLPSGVGAAIAKAIVHVGGVAADDPVLELGAGTGEIGAYLAKLAPGYVGLDDSPAMLDLFRAKSEPASPRLVVADANEPWPLPPASTQVIFASRVIHLLQPGHVVRETLRVSRPGAYLMLGRVQREPGSPRERLRQRRQYLLREAGMHPRQGESGSRNVVALLTQAGWTNLGRHEAAAWTAETSVNEVLAGWNTLSRMGSVEVDKGTREQILREIRDWAAREIGELDRLVSHQERYVLDIVQRPAAETHPNT
jgi:ubiquinone/menaquinone biosynthesis C-methylase UbiE